MWRPETGASLQVGRPFMDQARGCSPCEPLGIAAQPQGAVTKGPRRHILFERENSFV